MKEKKYRNRASLALAVVLAAAVLTVGCGNQAETGTESTELPEEVLVTESIEVTGETGSETGIDIPDTERAESGETDILLPDGTTVDPEEAGETAQEGTDGQTSSEQTPEKQSTGEQSSQKQSSETDGQTSGSTGVIELPIIPIE